MCDTAARKYAPGGRGVGVLGGGARQIFHRERGRCNPVSTLGCGLVVHMNKLIHTVHENRSQRNARLKRHPSHFIFKIVKGTGTGTYTSLDREPRRVTAKRVLLRAAWSCA